MMAAVPSLMMQTVIVICLCHGVKMIAAANISGDYTRYAKGAIVSPYLIYPVTSLSKCSAICRRLLVCSAFSTKAASSAGSDVTCSIALDDFTWVPDPDSSLYMEDIGLNHGYTLLTDGRFYMFIGTSPATLKTWEATSACNAKSGQLPVPYPKARRDVISAFVNGSDYFIGIMSFNQTASNGTWNANDGATFRTNMSDPNQFWLSGRPATTTSGLCVYQASGTWRDTPCLTAVTARVLCRRGLRYERSAVNGKYYKSHYARVTHARAEARCASEGGQLANGYGSANKAAIAGPRAAINVYGSSNAEWGMRLVYSFNIAGTDAEVEGIWKLPDGTSFNVADKDTDPEQTWERPDEPTADTLSPYLIYAPGDKYADIYTLYYAFTLCEIKV